MKTILLWDLRFPDRRPARLSVEDTVASAAVRAGVAATANPAEAGALSAGGVLDPSMLTEVVLQHGSGGSTRRVFLPYSVVLVGALAGVLASIGTPIPGGFTPTPTPSVPAIVFGTTAVSIAEGDSGTKTVGNVINVTRNGVTGPLTVNLSYGGTATSGTDYVAGPVSGTIADGQSSLSFDLTINGDTAIESDETIVINAVLAAYSSATATKTIIVTNDNVTVTPTPGVMRVIVAAGQSNIPGRGPYTARNTAEMASVTNLKQYPSIAADTATYRTIRDSVLPLYHPENLIGSNYFGPPNAAAIVVANAHPNDTIVVIPVAWGATTLVTTNGPGTSGAPQWVELTGSLNIAAVNQVNAFFAAFPNAVLHSIHWIQGENDAQSPHPANSTAVSGRAICSDYGLA